METWNKNCEKRWRVNLKKKNRKCKDNRGRVVGKCEEADFRGMVWFESRFEQKWKMLKVSSWNCNDTFSWYICHMALRWMLSMSMSRVLIVCRIWIKWLFCWIVKLGVYRWVEERKKKKRFFEKIMDSPWKLITLCFLPRSLKVVGIRMETSF